MELNCTVQNYEWGKTGSSSLVARLKASGNPNDFQIVSNNPYAELWMGSHPNGPSIIASTGEKLGDWIAAHPKSLGSVVRECFGDQLPFLFKVLSVNKALSIQAHPSKEHAEQLHRDHPDLYKDPNHKPELAIALTPFEALCGFRPLNEIKDFLQKVPELQKVIGQYNIAELFSSDEVGLQEALQKCFHTLMTHPKDELLAQLENLLARHTTLDESSLAFENASLIKRLSGEFPGDVGCFCVYFLNVVNLKPGEALYLGPNEPHAYLSGDCIECMACSDNVVRAGLTPKFIDVETLCGMLTYSCEPANKKLFVPTEENSHTLLFSPPVPDFAVAKITVNPASGDFTSLPRTSASIIIVVEGNAESGSSSLKPGKVIFLPTSETLTIDSSTIQEPLLMFQAFANL